MSRSSGSPSYSNLFAAVPKTVESLQALPCDDQLRVLWVIYDKICDLVTLTAPGAPQRPKPGSLLQQVVALPLAEQRQFLHSLLAGHHTPLTQAYAFLSSNSKLAFWYQLADAMRHGQACRLSPAIDSHLTHSRPTPSQSTDSQPTDWVTALSTAQVAASAPSQAKNSCQTENSCQTDDPALPTVSSDDPSVLTSTEEGMGDRQIPDPESVPIVQPVVEEFLALGFNQQIAVLRLIFGKACSISSVN